MKSLPCVRNMSCALLLCVPMAGMAIDLPPANVEIRTLSNRADLISSGDALVDVRLPVGVAASQVSLRLNGTDVTSMFQFQAAQGRFIGLLSGLVEGVNDVDGGAGRHRRRAALRDLDDHQPFARRAGLLGRAAAAVGLRAREVATSVTVTVPGTTLLGADDDPGERPRRRSRRCEVQRAARSSPTSTSRRRSRARAAPSRTPAPTRASSPYDPASPPPSADIANFTNDRGDTVKSIIRVERGTIDRGIYERRRRSSIRRRRARATAAATGLERQAAVDVRRDASASPVPDTADDEHVFNDDALSRGFMVASVVAHRPRHERQRHRSPPSR